MKARIDYRGDHLRIKRNIRKTKRRKSIEINETIARQTRAAIEKKRERTKKKVKRRSERIQKRKKTRRKVRRRILEINEMISLRWMRKTRIRRKSVKIIGAKKKNL